MKKTIIFLLLSLPAIPTFAVIAKPGSGVYGDEHRHYRMDSQGRIIDLVERQEPASSISKRRSMQGLDLEASFPVMGDVPCLVLLVDFTDVHFSIPNPQKAFSRMLNEEGYSENGSTGSARDYFLQSSMGQFRPRFDVYGPIQVDSTRAYYGGNGDAHVRDMVLHACVNFTQDMDSRDWVVYDSNHDGQIDNVFIIFAGANESEGGPEESIWPHRSYAIFEGGTIYRIGGKYLWDYACTSELKGTGDEPTMSSIGTFCHEFSHVMGLADLYNTKNSSIYTVGEWDLMCSGNYNNDGHTPPSYSAFERWMMGWLTPRQLHQDQECYLDPLETGNAAYLIADTIHNMNVKQPEPREYWLIENRQRVGWDAPKSCIAGTGLLISHIYFNANNWLYNTANNAKPLLYDICEPSYKFGSYATAYDTYPGAGNVTFFTPTAASGKKLSNDYLSNIHVLVSNGIAFQHGDETANTTLRIIRVGNQWLAQLPRYADENDKLYIYDTSGNLLTYVSTIEGEDLVVLPTEDLRRGCIYIVKMMDSTALKRGNQWAKFLY